MYELLTQKFSENRFSEVISIANSNNVTADNDPASAHVLAAAFFSLGKVQESLEILADLEISLGDDDNFLSLYGAVLRRSGDLSLSSEIFKRALIQSPDNPNLNNNYTNLLIDLCQFSEAKLLLESIVKSHPDYKDAAENLIRVDSIISSKSDFAVSPSSDINSEPLDSKAIDVLLDPLLRAFDSEEVKEHGRLDAIPSLKDAVQTTDVRSIGLEKLKIAYKAVREKNPNYAMELCSQSYKQLGCEGTVFDCVSDAYLSIGRYLETEISILHSLILSGPSMKNYINLTSLASMRCDFKLADFYLQKAICLDSSDPSILPLKKHLESRKSSKSASGFHFENCWFPDSLTQCP